MSAFFEVRHVSRVYRQTGEELVILKDVNLAVDTGDFVSVQGTSGTGKTTLLHIMGLLDRPTSGQVFFDGEEVGAVSDSRRGVLRAVDFAFVFQFYYLLPEFDALHNVAFPALIARGTGVPTRAPLTKSGRLERAAELLARVGLSGRHKHRPHQLSGGERQRVAIARALMNQPRIVFCDEPTGNLDPKTAAGVQELFGELNATLGQTFVVVTHEERMAAVAKRRVILADGVIELNPSPPAS